MTAEIDGEEVVVVRDHIFLKASNPGAGELWVRDKGIMRPATEAEATLCCNRIAGVSKSRETVRDGAR